MTVAAILKHKGSEVVSTTEDTSIAILVRLLVDRRIGAVPVMNEAGQLAGIISERDVVGALGAHGAAALEMRVGHLMIKIPPTGTPATTVEEAMEIMTHQRFRHLPILAIVPTNITTLERTREEKRDSAIGFGLPAVEVRLRLYSLLGRGRKAGAE